MYTIITRPIQAKPRGRQKSVLPDDVADAVRQAVADRTVEALIGVDDAAAGKKLLGAIKARVRDGSFGDALSVRGSVTESSNGKVVVIFSVRDYKPHTQEQRAQRKPHVRKPKAVETVSAPVTLKPVASPKRARRQPVSA